MYAYDNSGFFDFLSQKGFFVASKSQANYAQTDLSLASSLNLMYLDEVAAAVGTTSSDRLPLAYMIQNNAVSQFLKQRGYTIVALASGYSATDLRSSDIHVGSGRAWNELEIRLLCSTPIPRLAIRGSVFDPYAMHRERILYTLNHIADAAELPSRHFAFAHVLAPHGPFVFDEQGNEIQRQSQFDLRGSTQVQAPDWTWEDHLAGYTGQVSFINDKIQPVLDDLLTEASRPTVVILQSDHGPGSRLGWDHPNSTSVRDRFAILNAYLLPGDGSAHLYDEITPVNTFRLILNQYLGTELQLLEDESFLSSWERPYQFVNVTDRVRSDMPAQPSE